MASIGAQEIYYYIYMSIMFIAIGIVLSKEEKATDVERKRKGREIK
jgi:hypothetical protein